MKRTFLAFFLILTVITLLPFEPVSAQPEAITVDVLIDLSGPRALISPYIYGTNQDLPGFEGWTVRRLGGNRMTGYNWENNASNAGKDWKHSSDNHMCSSLGISSLECAKPAATITRFHDRSLEVGAQSLLTLPMAGYVAADMRGAVNESETAPSPRWVTVQFAKSAPFASAPDAKDSAVYVDELVHYLKEKYGEQGIWAFSLDNEPGLWFETHPRLHPAKLTAVELITLSTKLAQAIKAVEPNAQTFGPALYGFWAYMTLQDAPDWETIQATGRYSWFINYYLEQMAQAEAKSGLRLLDVLDVHWYSEARGDGLRVVFNGAGTEATQKARLQAPRTLWDPTYREDSWILDAGPQKLPIIPNLQASIEQFYPGTRLGFSEWGFGGENHISGGLAAADALGIFGKYGVYQASHWSTEEKSDYVVAAFRLYRDYDGQGGQFGDTSLTVENPDIENLSVYASTVQDDSAIHIILLNKNFDQPLQVNITLQNQKSYTFAEAWSFDFASPTLNRMDTSDQLGKSGLVYEIPPLSAHHLVLRKKTFNLAGWAASVAALLVITIVALSLSRTGKLRYSMKNPTVKTWMLESKRTYHD